MNISLEKDDILGNSGEPDYLGLLSRAHRVYIVLTVKLSLVIEPVKD